jgi:hypothetical protein
MIGGMNWTLLGLIVLAIFVIAAPFATLRSISWLQARRDAARARPLQDEEDDPDKPTGFW